VEHFQPEVGFDSKDGWAALREVYEEERLAPAPANLFVIDPISRTPIGITKKGREFLSKKWGFQQPVTIQQDGRLIETGAASVYAHPETKSVSVCIKKKGGFAALSSEEKADIARIYQLTGGLPPSITLVGKNLSDWGFPDDTISIRPLPFCCPSCKAQVKEGRIDYPAPDPALSFDRVLSCHCIVHYLRRDYRGPSSSADWQFLRDKWLYENARHHAVTTDGKS
jgi:hypothetical protein